MGSEPAARCPYCGGALTYLRSRLDAAGISHYHRCNQCCHTVLERLANVASDARDERYARSYVMELARDKVEELVRGRLLPPDALDGWAADD